MHLNLALRNNPYAVIIHTLVVCLLAGSTIGFGTWFIHSEYTALYLYEITALLLINGSLAYSVWYKRQFLVPTLLHFSLGIYSIYILVHGLWIKGDFNIYHEYLLISCALAVTLPIFISSNNTKIILVSILGIAFIIAIVCLLQAVKFLPTLSGYFDVTGTFSNPNITAMLLSLALCVAPLVFAGAGKLLRKVILVISGCILIALWLLGCRSAWIGLFVWGVIQLDYRYNLMQLFIRYRKSGMGILGIILGGLLLLTLGLRLYKSKEASTDGRKLIWKVSSQMISAKPVTGFGYGHFEKHYNVYQAKYFADGQGSANERQRAGHVNMAYNELLQHGVEGGLLGSALFAILFIAVFWARPKTRQGVVDSTHSVHMVMAYSGIMAFLAMSMVNFTVQAIPVMALFVVYLAIFISGENQQPIKVFSFTFNAVIRYVVLVVSCLFLFKATKTMAAAASNKSIVSNSIADLKTQRKKMDALAVVLSNYVSFWKSYGDLLLRQKHYNEALSKYSKAKDFSSEPGLYLSMATCHEKQGQILAAINYYQFLSHVQPSWLKPRIALLKLYEKQRDTTQAIQQAKEILAIVPRVKNTKAIAYKKYAQMLLERLQPEAASRTISTVNNFLKPL